MIARCRSKDSGKLPEDFVREVCAHLSEYLEKEAKGEHLLEVYILMPASAPRKETEMRETGSSGGPALRGAWVSDMD
jgi:hypothetical protein